MFRFVDTSRKQTVSEDPVTSNLTEPSGNLEEERNAGETEKDASEAPDQGLIRGGLPAPVRFRCEVLYARARISTLVVIVTVAGLSARKAAEETPPPGRRGSEPSRV